jgi:hypothetical protein
MSSDPRLLVNIFGASEMKQYLITAIEAEECMPIDGAEIRIVTNAGTFTLWVQTCNQKMGTLKVEIGHGEEHQTHFIRKDK